MWYDLGVIEDHYQDPDYDFYGERYQERFDDDDYWEERRRNDD